MNASYTVLPFGAMLMLLSTAFPFRLHFTYLISTYYESLSLESLSLGKRLY